LIRPKKPPTTELMAARWRFSRKMLINPDATIAAATAHSPLSGVSSCSNSQAPMNSPTRIAV